MLSGIGMGSRRRDPGRFGRRPPPERWERDLKDRESKPPSPWSPGHHLLRGTAFVFLAEALFPLTGIVTAAFLTRRLGAESYGILTLTATLISWIEVAIGAFFAQATVKVIGDAEDWRPAGTAVLRLQSCVGLGAMAAVWVLAKPVALLLGEPGLAGCLALYAIDIPLNAWTHCHRNLLVGRGKYVERATVGAGRWIARLVLILVLVGLGFSLTGALAALLGASVVELAIARYHIRPAWSRKTGVPVTLWGYAVPTFLASMSLRLMNVDLFLLKSLGASAAVAGIYGASQNVAFIMPGVFAVSFSPLLLSTILRVRRDEDAEAARTLGRNAVRLVLCAIPVASVAAAASDEIAVLLFGAHFRDAGPLMSVLVFAGLAMMTIALMNSVLIAWGKPSWPIRIAAPLLPLAIAGHLLAIPRFGPLGAAWVTAIVTGLGGLAGLIAVLRLLGTGFPAATLARALLLSGLAAAAACVWPARGPAAVLEVAAALLLVLAGFWALGEFRRAEIRFFQTLVRNLLSPARGAQGGSFSI